MPATTKVPLGASTTNAKWQLDVNTGTFASPTWVGVFGITEFNNTLEANLEDDTDFDSGGFQSQTKTGEAWGVEIKVARKVTVADPEEYNVGQEFLRGKAFGQMGAANSVDLRFYETPESGPREEAYRGNAAVSWSPDGGSVTDLSTVTVTLTGQGRLAAITHPDA